MNRRLRLLRSDEYPDGRLQIYIEARDGWVGVYDDNENMYVLPVPLLVVRWSGDPQPLCLTMAALVGLAGAFDRFGPIPSGWWLSGYLFALTLMAVGQYWRRVSSRRATQPRLGDWRTRPLHPLDLDHDQVVRALTTCGWHPAGGRSGCYSRLRWPGENNSRGQSVLVPNDPTYADHEDMMRGVLLELADAANRGQHADRALSILADGRPEPDPNEPTDLDYAMWVVWLESGRWKWATQKMTTDAREAAVAAVLRYDRRLKADDPDDVLLTREDLAWWEQ